MTRIRLYPEYARSHVTSSGLRWLGLGIIAAGAVTAAYSYWEIKLWLAPFSIVSFFAAQCVFPRAAFDKLELISPRNFALVWFFGALILAPLSAMFLGPHYGTLPQEPGAGYSNAALFIYNVAFWAFQWGCSISLRDLSAMDRRFRSYRGGFGNWRVVFFGLCVIIGFIGLRMRFGSLGGMVAFYADTTNIDANVLQEQQTVGSLLRPLLTIGAIGLWSLWLDRVRGTRRVSYVALGSIVCAGICVLLNLSFNRGGILLIVIAISGTFAARIRRIRFVIAATACVLLLAILFLLGAVRSSRLHVVDAIYAMDVKEEFTSEKSPARQMQAYLGAPQFLGYFLLQVSEGNRVYYFGKTLLNSVVSPIPVIGAPFREDNGMYIYNKMIYGPTSAVVDQILPAEGEVVLNFGIVGLIPCFLVAGWLMGQIHLRWDVGKRRCAADSAAWLMVAYWYSMVSIGNIAVVSQLFIYSGAGVIGYLLVARCLDGPAVPMRAIDGAQRLERSLM